MPKQVFLWNVHEKMWASLRCSTSMWNHVLRIKSVVLISAKLYSEGRVTSGTELQCNAMQSA